MDEKYMEYALELAEKGSGFTNPNPLVGAVIVKDGRIVGEGYHQYYGGPHAEVNAFHNAREDVKGATMYVTLEPCSHYGKTPPCVDAIIKRGIKKVVIGMEDPNPLVSGRGVKILQKNGIEVITGLLEDKCRVQNEIFIKYITTKKPFCIFKSAMTLDGKISTRTGDSRWVSGEESRKHVHRLRQRVAGILVGVGTAIADDPMLTTRLEGQETKNPIRIIVDSKGKLPINSKIVETSGEVRTILVTTDLSPKDKLEALADKGLEIMKSPVKEGRVDIPLTLSRLGEMGIDSILVEGGSTIGYSFLEEGMIDKVLFFIAPKLIGGDESKTPLGGKGINLMKDAINLENIEIRMFGEDILVTGYPVGR
ncbi:bifunctional diaminohydroxyphosphoribosylaminopyrimidine deaminase/5-amino-6-(5-phosphoribosylamino)uracil reductase RibD [Gudongella sp. DL1XJH-153]|uniref:bifunctional diaminohydroxyphosphoribosylaminopyrimidine deaminase/5-amino-6-(5-phosphoribosylamino)uracil reductase RibD n=1 Tax=Gudongella sp. DL1XJH-153 TaxID=3409804 RepID=UPI003BB72A9D